MYTDTTKLQQHLKRILTPDEVTYTNDVLIPAVTQWINNYIGGSFGNTSDVEIVSNGGSAAVWSGHLDVVEVEEDDEILEQDDYIVMGSRVVKKEGNFKEGRYNIKVTGNEVAVPDDVTLATNYIIGNLLQPNSTGDVSEEKYMDYTVKYADVKKAVNQTAISLLEKYKAIYV
jgi:hypothetical protein